ncbi:ATP dependent DNA ligase [Cristinia sonorae]|uniref:ATP dependent DNA ligase n=1 Tax=Cristinia sonorae TaxID=1940300 RepID=A0A8K0UKS5_9AGAR|nr:ATP dependent DNA ligase [Cristinia sonorae]
MEICTLGGCIALVGDEINTVASATLQSNAFLEHRPNGFKPSPFPYHITLLSKAELRTLSDKSPPKDLLQLVLAALGPSSHRVHYLGLGEVTRFGEHALFVVCIWAKGQTVRKQLGLPPKHFHITLSAHDIHGVDKGLSTLLLPLDDSHTSPTLLDHLTYTLLVMQDYSQAQQYAVQLCVKDAGSEKGFLRLGDISLKTWKFKLAMLAFSRAFERSSSEQSEEYCVQKILLCSKETEWGTVFAEEEASQLPGELITVLVKPWPSALRGRIGITGYRSTMCRQPRDRIYIPAPLKATNFVSFYTIPRYFSWLIPFRIALMSVPRSSLDVAALASPHIGIRHIITLTEERHLPSDWFPERLGVKNTFIPVPDFHPLSIEQMDSIVGLMREEGNFPMLIHCMGGKGRSGLVAACYLAAFGFSNIPTDHTPDQPAMTASEAIRQLRAIRPVSVENGQQEELVSKWCSVIWKRRSVFPIAIPEPPPCSVEIEGSLYPDSNFFVFVGLPGAGKSWVAKALLARNPTRWKWCSQDEAGSRITCENEVGRFNGKSKLILDRCNTSLDDRRRWLALASHWSLSPICVSFEYDRDLCTSRAQTRLGHPTLPPGNRVRNAVEQMHNLYVAPSLHEGFSAIVHIRSIAAAEEFIERVSPPITLLKFPRTEHLLNLGAATSDDLISPRANTSFTLRSSERVVITEKVDGANMGFSLSADRTQILVQNRSHYVTSNTHEQFRKLDQWVDAHREDLYNLLDRDDVFAQRYILYGEWMAATHSVAYSSLPDWFLAFDLFDRSTGVFVDRDTLEGLLVGTSIRLVPILHRGQMLDENVLKEMVQTRSLFCDGPVEGVYVKVENDGKIVIRGKVVRGDFIAGNEHWTRGGIRLNQISQTLDDSA